MKDTSFMKLRVYKRAEELSDLIWNIVQTWKPVATDTVGKQWICAVDHIGAYIAAGTGQRSHEENKRCVGAACGYFNEARHWFRRADRRKLLHGEEVERLREMFMALGPLLTSHLNSIGRGAHGRES